MAPRIINFGAGWRSEGNITARQLYSEKQTSVHRAWEAKWGLEQVLTLWESEKSLGTYRDSSP